MISDPAMVRATARRCGAVAIASRLELLANGTDPNPYGYFRDRLQSAWAVLTGRAAAISLQERSDG